MARLTLPGALVLAALATAAFPAAAAASSLDDTHDQWLPSADDATWTWTWSDSAYSPAKRTEVYTVTGRVGRSFRLSWTEPHPPAGETATDGAMAFQQTDAGLVTIGLPQTPAPSEFPILCASASGCTNSVAGPLRALVWGTLAPTIAEPLFTGTRWSSTGGTDGDVASDNRYAGHARVVVPAFPKGVRAAKVVSTVTQAGAIGDPYGSGVRTVWWVRGVGPVRIDFRHTGGELTRSELQKTNLKPKPLPPEADPLPLNTGTHATFRWRNSKHMRQWSRQRFTVSQVVNGSARVDVKRLSGPINVVGSYLFSTRLSGITNLAIRTQAQTRATFPPLGPRSGGATGHRHFFTPYDLMTYGFNPVIPAYGAKGQTWHSSPDSKDWQIYGVTGVSKLIGRHRIHTPAGRFRAIGVRSTLRQKGYPFGSGTRTSWFAPGTGLVKLVFRHRDGSVSTVERLKG
jgi:hypothetical protein